MARRASLPILSGRQNIPLERWAALPLHEWKGDPSLDQGPSFLKFLLLQDMSGHSGRGREIPSKEAKKLIIKLGEITLRGKKTKFVDGASKDKCAPPVAFASLVNRN